MAPEPQERKKPLAKDEIAQLLQGGVAPKRVQDLVRELGISFDMSPAIETELRAAGATATLLEVLREVNAARRLAKQAEVKSSVLFPEGFSQWTMLKTMVIYSREDPLFAQFAGLHNIYVNKAGVTVFQEGKPYPDGTVFVFDLHDIRTFQGAIETRGRKFLA